MQRRKRKRVNSSQLKRAIPVTAAAKGEGWTARIRFSKQLFYSNKDLNGGIY